MGMDRCTSLLTFNLFWPLKQVYLYKDEAGAACTRRKLQRIVVAPSLAPRNDARCGCYRAIRSPLLPPDASSRRMRTPPEPED